MTDNIHMNVFRALADVSHTASKCILIVAIHRNRSAEGVSLLTQLLYMLVFGTRYLDLFWVPPWWSWWNTVLKVFYVASSAYIVWLMMRVYARTREREYAWKLATWSLAACLVTAPLVCLVFRRWQGTDFIEILWTFSIELESVCVLPQLLLLRQTSVPTVIDSYYLVTLGSYRFFYILNWILLAAKKEEAHPISLIFGIVQTALYADFAWVYWSRQRVKLRGGAVVDGDDLNKSLFVRRIIGQGSRADNDADNDDEAQAGLVGRDENGNAHQSTGRWGARGISVSADDTLHDHQATTDRSHEGYADQATASDARMIDPSHFEDEVEDDDGADAPPPPAANDGNALNAQSRGTEDETAAVWADNTGDDDAGQHAKH